MAKPAPIHPGEILSANFLIPMGLSQTRLADRIGVPSTQVNEICRGQRAITAETALRLAGALGRSARYWLTLQSRFDFLNA